MNQHGGGDLALPAQRAFVVQLSAAVDLAQGRVAGRVKHVVSGRATRFATLDGLLAFMVQVVADLGQATPEEA